MDASHGVPAFPRSWQLPEASQYAVATQSASPVHFALQVTTSHRKVPHDRVVAEHPPAPSQRPGSLSVPIAQLVVPHAVEVVG
jgi:hypothetical protein